MVEITLRYDGELSCVATHGPSQSELRTDAPSDNMGRGRTFSPTDLLATALGTCAVTTMAIAAHKLGLEFTEASAKVIKHMSSDSPRRVVGTPVVIEASSRGLDDTARRQLEAAAQGCPVARSLHPDVAQDVQITWI